jgi:putative FmdB family regulatory protein
MRFERMQRMSAEPLTDCPECDGHVHRIIQPVGIIFKGSGFYVTDNRSGSSSTLSPTKESDTPQEKSDSKEGESKKETSASKDKDD